MIFAFGYMIELEEKNNLREIIYIEHWFDDDVSKSFIKD